MLCTCGAKSSGWVKLKSLPRKVYLLSQNNWISMRWNGRVCKAVICAVRPNRRQGGHSNRGSWRKIRIRWWGWVDNAHCWRCSKLSMKRKWRRTWQKSMVFWRRLFILVLTTIRWCTCNHDQLGDLRFSVIRERSYHLGRNLRAWCPTREAMTVEYKKSIESESLDICERRPICYIELSNVDSLISSK